MVKKTIPCLALVFFIAIHAGYAKDKPQDGKVSETPICKIESSMKLEAVKASPDGKHVAYEGIRGGKRILVVDGKEKAEFNYDSGDFFLSAVVFSPDSKRVAYEGYRDGKHAIFVESEGEREYEIPFDRAYVRIVFSPDSKRLAIKFTAWSGSDQSVTVDGKAGKSYKAVTNPFFSADSRRVFYIAQEGGKLFMVLDGKEEKGDSDIVLANLSPDGNRVAYMAEKNNKFSVVVDGQEGPQYDEIVNVVFSPDSKRMAYMARENDGWVAVVDGKKGKEYGDYWKYTLLFSPDSKRVAYIAAKSKPWKKKALGDTEIMEKGDGPAPKKGPKWVVVVDGKEEKTFDYGEPFLDNQGWKKPKVDGTLVFSPDSKRMACVAMSGSILKMKFKSGREVTEIAAGLIKWFVMIDGKAEKQFDEIRQGSIAFSPDGRHIAYVAKVKDKWSVVVDGKERKPYDRIVSYGGRVVFDSSDTFHYLAREGNDIYLVEESLKRP